MTLATCSQCGSHVIAGDACPHCGTPTPAPAPEVGRYGSEAEVILERLRRAVAPKYQVRRILGYGGMAGVYLADEPRLGRQVAIKVMSPSLMVDPKLIDRFGQEARTIAQLVHPNIVTIYEVDDRDDLHYFTMTFVGGRTLGQVLSESIAPLPVDVVRAWLYQIADALGYAHQRGVVHRDIKPGNVLLDQRGNALVTDFGIAKVADADTGLTRTGMLVGTPAYMSPEQCQSARITGASDQYSLGAVVYQMLTGHRPFEGPTLSVMQAHVLQEPTPIRELRPSCPADLVAAVERMLRKRPEERWPTMSAAIAGAGASAPGVDGPLRERLELLAVQAASIQIESWPDVVREGAREKLRVLLLDATGRPLTDRRIDWRPEHAAVTCVLPDNTLLATAPGQTRVEAVSGNAATTLSLTVEPDPVREVEIKPSRASLGINGRLHAEVIVRDWDGTRLDDRAVLWSTSDPAIVSVAPDGVVVALNSGEAVVTVSTGGKLAAAEVTVTSDVVQMPYVRVQSAGPAAQPTVAQPSTSPALLEQAPARSASGAASTAGPAAHANVPSDAAPTRRSPLRSRRVVLLAVAVLVAIPASIMLRGLATHGSGRPIEREAAVASSPTPQVTGAPSPPTLRQAPDNGQSARQAATNRADSVRAPIDRTVPASRASTRPQSPGGPNAKASPASRPAVDNEPQPTPPATGTLEVRGILPAGATLTMRQPDGQSRSLAGRSVTLPAGDYVFEFSAPGYETDRQTVRLAPGESQTWTPLVRAVAQPRSAPSYPTAPAAPAHDQSADLNAIAAVVRGFVAAFDRRDARAVINLLPAEGRSGWQRLLESRDVKEFHASVERIDPAAIDGDAASVAFTVHVRFRNGNQNVDQELRFTGTAARDGTGWKLASLHSSS